MLKTYNKRKENIRLSTDKCVLVSFTKERVNTEFADNIESARTYSGSVLLVQDCDPIPERVFVPLLNILAGVTSMKDLAPAPTGGRIGRRLGLGSPVLFQKRTLLTALGMLSKVAFVGKSIDFTLGLCNDASYSSGYDSTSIAEDYMKYVYQLYEDQRLKPFDRYRISCVARDIIDHIGKRELVKLKESGVDTDSIVFWESKNMQGCTETVILDDSIKTVADLTERAGYIAVTPIVEYVRDVYPGNFTGAPSELELVVRLGQLLYRYLCRLCCYMSTTCENHVVFFRSDIRTCAMFNNYFKEAANY